MLLSDVERGGRGGVRGDASCRGDLLSGSGLTLCSELEVLPMEGSDPVLPVNCSPTSLICRLSIETETMPPFIVRRIFGELPVEDITRGSSAYLPTSLLKVPLR